jgi:hypothetical protein
VLYTPPGACPAGTFPDAIAYAVCGPCPLGGHCPGGNVVWPKPGYYAKSQTDLPVACNYANACPGVLFTTVNNVKILSTNSCSEGYEGEFCSRCEVGYTQVPTL